MNIKDINNYLDSLNHSRTKGIIKKSLDLLNNPEKSYKKIIVTGTNGKGSTVEFLKNLIAYDDLVGAFTSPHLYKINERFNVNLADITDDELIEVFNVVYDLKSKYGFEYSYFEFLTLMAYVYFYRRKVNYAIFEVGIGGRDDATNEVDYDLSIITSISYDHQDKLGNTIEEIALNKLGIVKNNKLIYTCSDEIYHFMWINLLNKNATYVSKRDMVIYDSIFSSFNYENQIIDLNMIGKNQATNAMLAIEAIKYLNINIKPKKIKKILEDCFIKCRLERVYLSPTVIIDGGHNIEAINNLIDVIKKYKKNTKIIYASMRDKNHKDIIKALENVASKMYFTEINDLRCEKMNTLYDECSIPKEMNKNYLELIENVVKESDKNDLVIITGSFYFVGEARKLFRKN